MSWYSLDVESNAQSPAVGSLISVGLVKITDKLDETFYATMKPITDRYQSDALAVSGFTWEETTKFEDPLIVFQNLDNWITKVNKKGTSAILISDNIAFDFQWINYYFWYFIGKNPFGFSGRRIGDLYCGLKRDITKNSEWKKKYRITHHSHNALADSLGNAEAILAINKEFNLNIPLE